MIKAQVWVSLLAGTLQGSVSISLEFLYLKKSIQGCKFNTFLSAELQSGRQLTWQCSEWVSFYTPSCQFSGSYASGGCGEVSHRPQPSQNSSGGSRPLIVWWDYRGTEEGRNWAKTLNSIDSDLKEIGNILWCEDNVIFSYVKWCELTLFEKQKRIQGGKTPFLQEQSVNINLRSAKQ